MPARLALAEAAIQAAFRLRPDAGEVHLARAGIFIGDTAIMTAPWLSWTLLARPCQMTLGYSSSKDTLSAAAQGAIKEALRNLEHAIELDPRNI